MTRGAVTALIAFLLGVLAGAYVQAADPVVTLLVRPQIVIARTDVRVEARVPRHADNRLLSIAWTSDVGTAGSTQRQLDGLDAAVLHVWTLPAQPPANYFFVATVFNALGKSRGRAEARIRAQEGS